MRELLAMLALVCLGASLAWADDPPQAEAPVSYHRDVRPIFRAKCQGCHQPAKPLGGYVMTEHALLMKPGETGFEAVVAGKPQDSYLLDQITPGEDGSAAAMPKSGEPLSLAEVDLVRRWIAEGAKDDSPAQSGPQIDAEHPPQYTLPPVITSVDYSPDGQLVAISGYHEVILVDAATQERVARLVGLSERIESVAFSPEGKRLAVAGGSPGRFGEIQIWNTEDKSLERSVTITYDTVYGLSWSGDGTRIAFGAADNVLRAIDASTGEVVLFQGAHDDWVLGTDWSKDDSHLISVSRDRTLKLTHVETQRFIDNVTSITPGALKGGLMAVARRPGEDQALVGGADGVPKLYKLYREKDRKIGDDFNLIRPFAGLPGRVFDVAFNKDGSQLAVVSSDGDAGHLRIYETESAKLIAQADVPSGLFSVAIHPEGKTVLVAGFDGRVRAFEMATGKPLGEWQPFPLAEAATVSQTTAEPTP